MDCLHCSSTHTELEACTLPLGPRGEVGPSLGGHEPVRLVRRLSTGVLGTLYLGERPGGGPTVAVKVLHPHLAERPGVRERLLSEALAAHRVRHPRVARVLDVHVLRSGCPCLLLEYAEGTSLCQWPLPMAPEEAVELLEQVLEGLEAVHALGLVHRDLRPAHVLVAEGAEGTRQVKLLDVGVAGVLAACLTEEERKRGHVPGSPAYLAPEQWVRAECDGRADLYSVAVLGYRLVTGRLPLGGGGRRDEMLHGRAPTRPVPPHTLNERIPPALSAVLLQALAVHPGERFASARALRAALRQALWRPGTRPQAAPAELHVALEDSERPGLWLARVGDVSPEGFFAHRGAPLPPLGTRLRAELALNGWVLACKCDVVRHVAGEEARTWLGGTGFYVAFAEPLEDVRRLVAQALAGVPEEGADPELARLLARVLPCSRNPYRLLALPAEADFAAVHEGARRAERRLSAFLSRPLPPGQRQSLQELLGRVQAARRTLGEPLQRLGFDAAHGNLQGVARCLEAGVPEEALERLRHAFLSTRPGLEVRARGLAEEALLLEAQGERQAALARYAQALALDPLNRSLHESQRRLQRRLRSSEAEVTPVM